MEAPPLRSFYRISDCSYPKPKLAGATKAVCLDNFLSVFAGSPVTVLADNCDAATLGLLDDLLSQGRVAEVVRTSFGNAGAFRRAMELACGVEDPATPVYLAEDDYLHLRGSPQLIREGLACAQYVTLYDHPDKYRAEYDGGEVSKVVRTRSSHWRFTVSTCMTFATTAGQLRQDADVWLKWTEGPHPFDHKAFAELRERGRRLAVCIPGAACHTDLTYSRMIGDYAVEDWAAGLINGASAGRGDGPAAACGTRGYRAAACAPASADEHESIERLVRESLVIAAGQVEDELLPFAHFVRHVVRPANVLEIGTDVGGLFHVLHHLCAGKCLSVSLPGGPWGSLSLRGGVRRALELTLRYPRAHVVVGDSHDPESLALLRVSH